ncbi:hypothetical protein N7481_001663 [Penicillium waksmanii]|uniref:uncharacterized protein n=1 Tax=Penicillium waksmanii TaxID=69791 RepID=UPI002548AFA8|nr:uncharacterized protein N7481_001663 [Penicillium waksmanii]KAJ5994686.1 hypothetical protein N7481_001663 [Penicillium waksmanii]
MDKADSLLTISTPPNIDVHGAQPVPALYPAHDATGCGRNVPACVTRPPTWGVASWPQRPRSTVTYTLSRVLSARLNAPIEAENRGIELAHGASIDGAEADRKRKHPHQGLVKGEAGFLRSPAAGSVKVIRAPWGMSRNKQNNSRWHCTDKCLSWTVEWVTADGTQTARNNFETYSIAEAYDQSFPLPRKEKLQLTQLSGEEQTKQTESNYSNYKHDTVDLEPADTTATLVKFTEPNEPNTPTSIYH